jgi:dienelactone hydrolase
MGRGFRAGLSAAMALGALATACATPAAADTQPDRASSEAAAHAIVDRYSAQAGNPSSDVCLAPAGDPAPGTNEWQQRDLLNMYCSTQRLQDELASPAFGTTFWSETPGIFAQQQLEMVQNPTHPHVTLAQAVPGGTTTDPYRTIDRWTAAGRGRVDKISFPADDGATLNGYVFRPPASTKGPYPGIVITTGSIQGYQQMYFWAAEGLAEAGYEVLTYDVQGQGTSDTLPDQAHCTGPSACSGVPFQQSYNFYQGTEDALNWFFSSANPGRGDLDATRVGLAGHSLGASAVSEVGQCDPRVKAIVAWDKLAATTGKCADKAAHLPAGAPASPSLKVPALGIHSEYFFNPTPQSSTPDPHAQDAAYKQLTDAGTDSMIVQLRSSTHLEYTYVPYILPASRLGERVAWYYTLAWFDRYVKGQRSALARLTAPSFDGSADASSIGAGTYDAGKAAANPADTTAGNVPYTLKGLPVADRLSFYYESEYDLAARGKQRAVCTDMRAGCPAKAPATP